MKSIYNKWFDGELKNINNFTLQLIKTYQAADGKNKARLANCFPEIFKNINNTQ